MIADLHALFVILVCGNAQKKGGYVSNGIFGSVTPSFPIPHVHLQLTMDSAVLGSAQQTEPFLYIYRNFCEYYFDSIELYYLQQSGLNNFSVYQYHHF